MNKINCNISGINYTSSAQNKTRPYEENKTSSNTKTGSGKKALKIAAGVAAVGAVAGIAAFSNYYRKGVDVINLKQKLNVDLTKDGTIRNYVTNPDRTFSAQEREFYIKTFEEAEKYQNNIVGKTNRAINAVREFFRNNIWGYDK